MHRTNLHILSLHTKVYAAIFLLFIISCKSQQTSNSNTGNSNTSEVSIAPDFSLNNLSGQKRTLVDYKGNIVLLNFWATWCPPCLAELPALNSIAKRYKDRGLKVVAISCDSPDELEKIKKMQAENSYEFDILLDPEISIPAKYGTTGFPESFFIGKTGELLEFNDPETKQKSSRIISERQWDSAEIAKSIEELL